MKTILQWPQLNCTTLPKLVGEKNPKFEFFSSLKVHCPKKITYDITFSVLFHPKISKSIWALKSLVFIFVTTDVALINAMNVQFQWKRLKPARLVNSLKASRGEQPNPCQSRPLLLSGTVTVLGFHKPAPDDFSSHLWEGDSWIPQLWRNSALI